MHKWGRREVGSVLGPLGQMLSHSPIVGSRAAGCDQHDGCHSNSSTHCGWTDKGCSDGTIEENE